MGNIDSYPPQPGTPNARNTVRDYREADKVLLKKDSWNDLDEPFAGAVAAKPKEQSWEELAKTPKTWAEIATEQTKNEKLPGITLGEIQEKQDGDLTGISGSEVDESIKVPARTEEIVVELPVKKEAKTKPDAEDIVGERK